MKQHIHLNLKSRIRIESELNDFSSFSKIGSILNKDRTTISKEVKRNCSFFQSNYAYNRNKVSCKGRCTNRLFCTSSENCTPKSTCYIDELCPNLLKPPFVCNSCSTKKNCRLSKYIYQAAEAQELYELVQSDSRVGARASSNTLDTINSLITPLIQDKKQSLYHVYTNHQDVFKSLGVTLPTLYRLVDDQLLTVRNIDLRLKPRRKLKTYSKKRAKLSNIKIKKDRSHKHFELAVENNEDISIVELDTVKGLIGDKKCLLTLYFRKYSILYARLLDSCTTSEVTRVFNELKDDFGCEEYKKHFQIILADNGSEFNDPVSVEYSRATGDKLCSFYYCDPNSSYQRAKQERNHVYLRYILPKKKSFDDVSDELVEYATNQISNLIKKSLKDLTSYEVALKTAGKEFLDTLKIKKILPDDIDLSSKI